MVTVARSKGLLRDSKKEKLWSTYVVKERKKRKRREGVKKMCIHICINIYLDIHIYLCMNAFLSLPIFCVYR